ncbi:MAG: chlorophyll synthesis pathway protein BchC [Luminiphilus sp.]|nr:chlorophyll synthesis pathway protein BchC [Luminiphilus sp.]
MRAMSTAVVFEQPGEITLRPVELPEPHSTDCVVEVQWTGISTGTERLLWDGCMPPFPGLAYPLVPGYESVGSVLSTGERTEFEVGQRVFVPGSRGFKDVHGLFGGAARSLVVPAERLVSLPSEMESTGVLLALAATACHALRRMEDLGPPELIIGHGALGRLLARVTEAQYRMTPVVWETAAERREGNHSYTVIDPADDDRRDYRRVCDVSGASLIIDQAVHHLAKGATVLLAGFYAAPIQFQFPAAFMREIDLRISAEWQPKDMQTALDLISGGDLSLSGIITHDQPYDSAETAYQQAFSDPRCLKMVLDWRDA